MVTHGGESIERGFAQWSAVKIVLGFFNPGIKSERLISKIQDA